MTRGIDWQELTREYNQKHKTAYHDDSDMLPALYAQGYSLFRIAEMFQVSSPSVRSRLLAQGVKLRPRGGANYTDHPALEAILSIPEEERAHMTSDEIELRALISRGSLYKWDRQIGIRYRKQRALVTSEEVQEMIRLREAGLTYREIGAKLGRSPMTVRNHVGARARRSRGRSSGR